jgi:hypothetical protein
MMRTLIKGIVKIFQITSFAFAAYMTYLQFERYMQNGDISSIQFRTFNYQKKDTYPSFSMCLKGLNGEMYEHDQILSIWNDVEYEKGAKMYQDALRGGGNFSKDTANKNFDNVTLDFLNDIFVSIQTHTKEGDLRQYETLPIYNSYQDTRYVCFTRDIKFEQNLLLNKEKVFLNPDIIANRSLTLMIFLHQEGQLTKQLLSDHEPLIEFKYQDFQELFAMYEELYKTKSFYTADIRISQVEVLRRRADSTTPCHDQYEEHNEDHEWIMRVMKQVGCIPTFWRRHYHFINNMDQMKTESSLDICKNASDYVHIDKYTSRYNKMKKRIPKFKSCKQTSIFANVDIFYRGHEKHEFLMQVNHINEEYKETLNTRGFNDETLLSTVGGYIGIFLGYSLLQMPSMFIDLLVWLKLVENNLD